MNRKKIIIVNDLLYGGGAEKVLMTLANNLDLKSYKLTIVSFYNCGDSKKYYDKKIKYKYLYCQTYNNKNFFNILKRIYLKMQRYIIKNIQYDIAIAFKEGNCMKFVSNLNAKNKLAWIHVDYCNLHWTKELFKKNEELECMKNFNSIVCVSKSVKEAVINTIGNPDNLYVRYNPINEKEVINKSYEEISDIKKDKDKVLFITVGRLVKEKGYDRLLKVCNNLNKKNRKFELWIIGEGDEHYNLKKYINENNLKNVKILGHRENPYKYMALADWIVCSSRCEGYNTVLQEAAILEIPIITTNCSGSEELLGRNNEFGVIVENSYEGLCNGLLNILDGKYIRDYYKTKIKDKAATIILENSMNKIIELFN